MLRYKESNQGDCKYMTKHLHYPFVLFLIPTVAVGVNPEDGDVFDRVSLSSLKKSLDDKTRNNRNVFAQSDEQDRVDWVAVFSSDDSAVRPPPFASVITDADDRGAFPPAAEERPFLILEDFAFELFALEMGHDLSFINAADLRRMRALYKSIR